LEDDPDYMPFPKTHLHNTEVTVAGITYARTVEILPPYSVEFENGSYSVRLEGANNNVFDVEAGILVQNTVQVIPTNSAGLQVVVQGSGVTQQDKDDIVTSVYAHADAGRVQSIDLDAVDDLAMAPSASVEIADGIFDRTDGAEAGMTLRQWLHLGAALLFGKTTGFGTTEVRFRDLADSKNRIAVTHDVGGDRTAVTLTPD